MAVCDEHAGSEFGRVTARMHHSVDGFLDQMSEFV